MTKNAPISAVELLHETVAKDFLYPKAAVLNPTKLGKLT
jgi:hypothetical protein